MKQSKILIIDDDKTVSKIVTNGLIDTFDQVESIFDPTEALKKIKTFCPDLILLDWVMPKLNGLELLKMIRESYSSLSLPVIMMTSLSDEQKIVEALELGANDYLIKPFSFEVATARIKTQLKAAQASRHESELQQLKAMSALITTYNHGINNPLAIAQGYLQRSFDKLEPKHIDKASEALDRIVEIVKKIGKIIDEKEFNITSYANSSSDMIDFKGDD